MQNIVFIGGHKNPDTDSICSAIAYAEFKRKLGVNAVAVRLGHVNQETQYVLNYFGVDAPEYMETVKTQVSDLDMDIANCVSPEISVKTAWSVMVKNNVHTLAVVDEDEKLIGIVTHSSITNKYMDALENNMIGASNTSLINVVETLNGELLVGTKEDFKTTGRVLIMASYPDDIKRNVELGDIAIVGNRKDSMVAAIEAGANLIVLTQGAKIDSKEIELAKKHRCIIISTPTDTFTASRLINQSVPIRYVMTTQKIVKFNDYDFVDEVKDKMLASRYRSYPVVDENNIVKGFISRFHLISPRRKKIILVDHNDKVQSFHGIDDAEILEIIDHHKLGDIQTIYPVFFKNETVGCTCTIIANIFFDTGIKPSKAVAGLMCAAIISDTIKFKSPTCRYTDRITAEKLAEIAHLNIDDFALQMFKAGSTLKGKSLQEIVKTDLKEFKIGKYKTGMAQVYSIDFESLHEIKDSLLSYMNQFCKEKSYDLLLLLVTDILNQNSELLYAGDAKDLIGKAFNVDVKDNSVYLPDVVSRKKQVVPKISMAALNTFD